MKRNKKGFTLIELLAVIVILAIIALIATPIILNIIERVRKGAAQDSAYNIRKSAELYREVLLMDDTDGFIETTITFSKNGYEGLTTDGKTISKEKLNNDGFEIDGTSPIGGSLTIKSDGKISLSDLIINGYRCNNIENNKVKCVKNGSSSSDDDSNNDNKPEVLTGPTSENPSGTGYTGVLKIVYLDPTDLTKYCTASNSVSDTETKEGCMKWYAYSEDTENYTMLLDHNAVAGVQWNSDNDNTSQKEIAQALSELNEDWEVSADLITEQEIRDVTGNTGTSTYYFNGNSSSGQEKGSNIYAWLFDNTKDCETYGCSKQDNEMYDAVAVAVSPKGYWTKTAISSTSSLMWAVSYSGWFVDTNSSDYYGLRPVITVPKSIIK